MPSRNSAHSSIPAAASYGPGGGCRPGYLLPLLAVAGIGAVLMFFTLGAALPANSADIPDQAAEIQNNNQLQPLSSVFTPEVQYWAERIQKWSAAAGLDPNLAATVMQIESCGDPLALSSSGAMGLFQVMPYHFTDYDDPYAPDTNALRGLDYLRRSLESGKSDPRLALAGYNGGIGIISLPESEWTAETQRYTTWGSGIYAEASSGSSKSLRLQEWLATSGASLCRQAHKRLGISP